MTQTQIAEPHPKPLSADAEVCGECDGECAEACFNDAIQPVAGNGFQIQAINCAGCGACIPACLFNYIRLEQGVARLVRG